jgi:hypothetical protein
VDCDRSDSACCHFGWHLYSSHLYEVPSCNGGGKPTSGIAADRNGVCTGDIGDTDKADGLNA